MNDESIPRATRRRSFIAATGLGALTAWTPRPALAATGPATPLTPQVTEGPFYFDPGLVRTDVTEGRHGVPLEVCITVVDAQRAPLAGARVDLWHCDASGAYSGYAGQGRDAIVSTRGKTFLRGTVLADQDGLAVFRTIWPGWYEGRTPHIHYKVFSGARLVLTSQLFLPDALSEYLYTNVAAYKRVALRDTLNRDDGIAHEAGPDSRAAVREDDGRYVLAATAVVDPQARVPKERMPGPPPGAPDDRKGPSVSFRAGNTGGPAGVGVGFGHRRGGPPGGAPPSATDRGPDPFRPHRAPLDGEARVAALVPSLVPAVE